MKLKIWLCRKIKERRSFQKMKTKRKRKCFLIFRYFSFSISMLNRVSTLRQMNGQKKKEAKRKIPMIFPAYTFLLWMLTKHCSVIRVTTTNEAVKQAYVCLYKKRTSHRCIVRNVVVEWLSVHANSNNNKIKKNIFRLFIKWKYYAMLEQQQ